MFRRIQLQDGMAELVERVAWLEDRLAAIVHVLEGSPLHPSDRAALRVLARALEAVR
jgi:hypothetical protein